MPPHLTMSAKACAESAYVDLALGSHGHSEESPQTNVHCFVQKTTFPNADTRDFNLYKHLTELIVFFFKSSASAF